MIKLLIRQIKWDELRLWMYALAPPPIWSTLSASGYRSQPDREWFHHFREGGYEDILCVDIQVQTPAEREAIGLALKAAHVPGEETSSGFRVFGTARMQTTSKANPLIESQP